MPTVKEIIREEARDNGIARDAPGAILCVTELFRFALQPPGDLFLAWDALGCCPNRTPIQEHLYKALSGLRLIQGMYERGELKLSDVKTI